MRFLAKRERYVLCFHLDMVLRGAYSNPEQTPMPVLTQPSQLRTLFGFFALIFIVKPCVFIVAL